MAHSILGGHPRSDNVKHLTTRQREVLQLLGEGRTMKEAAAVLHLTERTVAFHKYRMMKNFCLKNNVDLVRFAMRERLLAPLEDGPIIHAHGRKWTLRFWGMKSAKLQRSYSNGGIEQLPFSCHYSCSPMPLWHVEDHIRDLCSKAASTKDHHELVRVLDDLRSALKQHANGIKELARKKLHPGLSKKLHSGLSIIERRKD